LALLVGVILVVPLRAIDGSRFLGWAAAGGAAVTAGVVLALIAAAPKQLAGGDQCPSLSTNGESRVIVLELLCAAFAAVAVGSIFGSGSRFGGLSRRIFVTSGALASVGAAWFVIVAFLGACGS
jgi:hypothetical protein